MITFVVKNDAFLMKAAIILQRFFIFHRSKVKKSLFATF